MIGPEVTVPDVTEAVVGYRQFALQQHTQHNFRLVSPHQGTPWVTAETRATCNIEVPVPDGLVLATPLKPHAAPAKNCGCGIYAYFDPCPVGPLHHSDRYLSFVGDPSTQVAALVTLSGRLEVHARGMRAARGRVCALGLNPRLGPDEKAALREIANGFGAALVDENELAALASEYGKSLAASMRPHLPPPEQPPMSDPDNVARYLLPSQPRRRKSSRWDYLPTAINATCGAANGLIIALVGPAPLSVASCGFSFGTAAFFDAKRRRAARTA